jgi:hypothetical protein
MMISHTSSQCQTNWIFATIVQHGPFMTANTIARAGAAIMVNNVRGRHGTHLSFSHRRICCQTIILKFCNVTELMK